MDCSGLAFWAISLRNIKLQFGFNRAKRDYKDNSQIIRRKVTQQSIGENIGMKFSLHIETRISDWQIIKDLEDMGYDAVWVPDTQMMWSDCYATMAAAALVPPASAPLPPRTPS